MRTHDALLVFGITQVFRADSPQELTPHCWGIINHIHLSYDSIDMLGMQTEREVERRKAEKWWRKEDRGDLFASSWKKYCVEERQRNLKKSGRYFWYLPDGWPFQGF